MSLVSHHNKFCTKFPAARTTTSFTQQPRHHFQTSGKMPSEKAPAAAGSIAFGSMPPGVYSDPADCRHYHSLLAQIRHWGAYVGLQAEKIQQQLEETRFMAPGTEEWHIAHADIRHRLRLLLCDMRRTKEYAVEVGKASIRYQYNTRLSALNQRLQGVHLHEEGAEGQGEREVTEAESQEPTTRIRQKNHSTCKDRSDDHGIRPDGSQAEPAQSKGQLALQKVQLRRTRWAQTRQSAKLSDTSAVQHHQGKKKPKKGRFKQERQEAENEIQRSRQRTRQ